MAIKKIEMRDPSNNYGDILFPKTSADMVVCSDDKTIQQKITDGEFISHIKRHDTRSVNESPATMPYEGLSMHFKNRETVNNAPGNTTYNTLLNVKQWSGDSGGNYHQMSFGNIGNVPFIGFRTALGSATAWEGWCESLLFDSRINGVIPPHNFTCRRPAIQLKATDNVDYGYCVQVGAGGLTVVGAGESYDTFYENKGEEILDSTEKLYLTSDGQVTIFSGMQSGWSNRKSFVFESTGGMTMESKITMKYNTSTESLDFIFI